jgi:sodium-dependent phosphate cotransporter
LVAAGVLTIEQIFPYTLGANIGTSVTAILAALAIGKEAGLAIAFSHMLFNIFGIFVFLPLRIIPIATAKFIAKFAAVSKKNFFIFLTIYILLHTLLIIFIFL